MTQYHLEHVVEVVGDAPGELAHSFHLLALDQLFPYLFTGLLRLSSLFFLPDTRQGVGKVVGHFSEKRSLLFIVPLALME